jgi:outer membrane protein assembly factor BamB
MKQILLMIVMVAVVGCGKKDPVQPTESNTEAPKPEKETGKEATQPTTLDTKATKPEPKVDPTKHERFFWEFETGGGVDSSPAIGSDGTVYVGSWDKKLYAINGQSGVKLWEFETGGNVQSSPAIGSDGTVYLGSSFTLYAINGKSGVKLWEFETGNMVSFPAIGSDGTVYVGSNDNKLYAINGQSGVKLWEFETGDVYSSPAIGSDGTVYVGSKDNKLYAILTDSKGLAKSPWPMRGQNPLHTGRVPGTKAPVAMPPGKAFAWTMGVNQQSLDRFYVGKLQAQVQKFFGKPDKTQGEWWGYTGMNITDSQGNKYSTAWFGFSNGMVQQVRFDK